MVIRDALGEGAKQLKKTADAWADAALDAELLLGKAMGMTREELYVHNKQSLTAAHTRRYNTLLARRKKHEPVAYLLGRKDFFGFSFLVERGACLIPRPETEILVERALALLKEDELLRRPDTTVIDIGTGSGAIALSIAHTLPDRSVIATDISPAARRIAKKNAVQLGVANRVSIQKADLLPENLLTKFHSTPLKKGAYDTDRRPVDPLLQGDGQEESNGTFLFLANLPYIPTRLWKTLPLSIRRFEPRTAFDGGPDGLALYRKLFLQIQENGIIGRWTLLAEIDPGQASAFSRAARSFFKKSTVTFHRDLGAHIRVAELTVLPHAAQQPQQATSARG